MKIMKIKIKKTGSQSCRELRLAAKNGIELVTKNEGKYSTVQWCLAQLDWLLHGFTSCFDSCCATKV